MIEVLNQPLVQGGLVLLPIIGMALSQKMRLEAIKHLGLNCKEEGRHGGIIEFSHTNHKRDEIPMKLEAVGWQECEVGGEDELVPYDDWRRTVPRCSLHHMEEHIDRQGENGLNHHQNSWSIERIKERLVSFGFDLHEI